MRTNEQRKDEIKLNWWWWCFCWWQYLEDKTCLDLHHAWYWNIIRCQNESALFTRKKNTQNLKKKLFWFTERKTPGKYKDKKGESPFSSCLLLKALNPPSFTFLGRFYAIIQGVFFLNWYPPKKLKYGKPRLGESTLT